MYQCTGSVIDKSFILTAGHCLITGDTAKSVVPPRNVTIVFSHSLKDIRVLEVIVHEGLNSTYLMNDIALLRLTKPLVLSPDKGLSAICLPKPYNKYSGKVIAAGWGNINTTTSSSKLQEATLYVDDRCFIDLSFLYKDPSFICMYGVKQHSFLCMGDSGGPIMRYKNGRFQILGVVSNSVNYVEKSNVCAKPNGRTTATKISYYLKWIYNRGVKPFCY